MGILNVTPDSFSDGGQFNSRDAALKQVTQMLPYIDILDIGGESTRPNAQPVSAAEEGDRILPIIEAIRAEYPNLPISVDTVKASVASSAIAAGADMLNDVSAGRFDLDMLPLVGKLQVPIFLMHMQGEPRTMQANPHYRDVVQDVKQFLIDAISVAKAWGISPHLIAIDPGIGFGKTLEHNLELIRNLSAFKTIKAPLLLGVSRKTFIGKLCDRPEPSDRLYGTIAACTACIAGGADILRVHDPQEIADACRVCDAIWK
ncbi:MAG: dihydropteroate synthase [Pseudanabaena sp. M090S1SP1A06QC]|nr:dihydropteroate synthase [Pseudanabaena sp. M051S1SP1A06QC]MCA6587768.1 dihydropteroate synthase [Pseudanabaena sp. M109S1SP1A06QC]MCA6604562.1 dihydropteroate synthase [Pseudanabaena sp. M007S1SP1A06QC]MCA6613761.1 dihydropteroate synthase [Pseudanabaena sp. M090S1SP1A06QC]